MLIQFVLSGVLLVTLWFTWQRLQQEALRRSEALLWSIAWIGIGVVVWWPALTTRIANLFGIGRGSDFVLYLAVVTLLFLVFQLHVAHDKLSRELTVLVRKDALRALPPSNAVEAKDS